MNLFRRLFLLTTLLLAPVPSFAQWQAGVGKVDITPTEPVPLAGYGGKTRLPLRVVHPIWIKALALRDSAGMTSVLVTADLVGLSEAMVDLIARQALEKHGLPRERLLLNYSHNHSCPVTGDVLWLYYEHTAEEKAACDRYTKHLHQWYGEVIGKAIADLKPADLSFEQGLAGVAVNRRRSRPGGRALGGQVDQDVPVLVARAGDQIRAVVFGYSCHTTALSGLTISGDYAGFAQIAVEKTFPGSVAMFVQNCGGDANPLPRIMGSNEAPASDLAQHYGDILAEAVRQVVRGKMVPLSGPLVVAMGTTELFFQPGPSLDELRNRLPDAKGMIRREIEHWIAEYESEGALKDRVPYPVQVWRFGPELTYIALTGETVVDYSLRFKAAYGWDTTWVAGYHNDLLSYVPSLRVLREGGYEGTTGIYEYGHRAPYTETVEQQIASKVEELVGKTRDQSLPP